MASKRAQRKVCKSKKKFATEYDARLFVGLKAPLRAYRCPICRAYHLASL